jgi:shikimate kinase
MSDRFRRIYLIGMMGSGKSHWAGKLGHFYHLPAYDLDRLIEEQAGKTIREIFDQEGEDAFRKLEAGRLRLGATGKKFVMATGGGTPCFYGNIDFMKSNGFVVWINPPADELLRRVSKSIETRPVLQGIRDPEALKAHLMALINKRRQWYSQADIVVEDDSTVEKIIEKINDFENNVR